MSKVMIVLVAAAFASGVVLARDDKPAQKPEAKPEQKSTPATAAFDKLKKLAGEWIDTENKGEDGKTTAITYRVVSAGSAVMETIMPGSDHEMVTMYHMDGDKLMLTHYCGLGNQPRMVSKGLDGNKVSFTCAGGTNMKSENDMHMHSVVFTFTDDDHVKAEWTLHKDGKQQPHGAAFNLTRKK